MDRIYLQGTTLALNKNQVISFLPDSLGKTIQDKINTIKAKFGFSPIIRAYSIAHEGTATPTTPGENKKAVELKFTEKALDWIKEKASLAIEKGLKFFDGHNPTNDTQTNKELGQVIGVKKITHNGKKHVIAIGVFKEDTPNRDISSMEFAVDVQKLNAGSDEAVDEITGIALADTSTGERPGFPEAKQLAEFQCFEFSEETTVSNINDKKENIKMELNLDMVKKFIRENDIPPQKIWEPGEIVGEPRIEDGKLVIEGGFNAINNKILGKLKTARIYDESQYKTLQDQLSKLPELEKAAVEYKTIKAKQIVSEQLPQIFKQRNFDEAKQKYANEILAKKKILDNINPNEDAITQINSKLDEIAEDYEFNFKTFGKAELPANVPALAGSGGIPGQSGFDY